MAADPSFTSKSFVQTPPSDFANSGTGTASGQDYVYAWTTVDGYYEIKNYAAGNVSSAFSNPNFPTFSNPTDVNLTLQATVGFNVVNVASGADASANAGHWSYDPSNVKGGLALSGALYTLSAGEFYLPVTQTATVGKYTLPNGIIIAAPATYSTGYQNFAIMPMAGPWPAGISANTSATVNGALFPVWADLGGILNSQGAAGLESLTNNWSPRPD
jgi:hypothetical protein